MFQNEVLIQSMDLAMEMIVFFRENGQILYANHLAYQLLEYQDIFDKPQNLQFHDQVQYEHNQFHSLK